MDTIHIVATAWLIDGAEGGGVPFLFSQPKFRLISFGSSAEIHMTQWQFYSNRSILISYCFLFVNSSPPVHGIQFSQQSKQKAKSNSQLARI